MMFEAFEKIKVQINAIVYTRFYGCYAPKRSTQKTLIIVFKQKSKSQLTTLLKVSAEASSDVVNILWI